jgi:hypothetical protein
MEWRWLITDLPPGAAIVAAFWGGVALCIVLKEKFDEYRHLKTVDEQRRIFEAAGLVYSPRLGRWVEGSDLANPRRDDTP